MGKRILSVGEACKKERKKEEEEKKHGWVWNKSSTRA